MNINKLQVGFKRRDHASVLARVMAPDLPTKIFCCMTINDIQVWFKKRGHASVLAGVIAPPPPPPPPPPIYLNDGKICFSNFCCNEWISLQFIWYMPFIKIQVQFEKGGYPSILTGVMMVNGTSVGPKLCYRYMCRFWRVYPLTPAYCHF